MKAYAQIARTKKPALGGFLYGVTFPAYVKKISDVSALCQRAILSIWTRVRIIQRVIKLATHSA